MARIRLIYVLSLVNFSILCYLAWVKHKIKGCQSCHTVPLLPINDITLALTGALAALFLILLYYGSFKVKYIKYFLLIYVALISSLCSFLQMSQYILYKDFCKLCLTSTFVFYLIFGLLVFDFVLQPLCLKKNENGLNPRIMILEPPDNQNSS